MKFADPDNFRRIRVSDPFRSYDLEAPSAAGISQRREGPSYGEEGMQPVTPDSGVFSSEGAETFSSMPGYNQDMSKGAASMAMSGKADVTSAQIYRKAQEAAARKMADAQKKGGLFGTIGKVIGTAVSIGSAFLCDMRLKTDVSALACCDVDDELAQLAFAVKALRDDT